MSMLELAKRWLGKRSRDLGHPHQSLQLTRASYRMAPPSLEQDEVAVARALTQSLVSSMSNNRQVRIVLAQASRSEDQRNGYYTGMLNRVSRDRVGTGPKLRCYFEKEEWNWQLQDRWESWLRATKMPIKLRTAMRDRSKDGACLGVMFTNPMVKSKVKLDVRFVDSLRLGHPYHKLPQGKAVDGIEFDQWYNPTSYWIDDHDYLSLMNPAWSEPKEYKVRYVLHHFLHQAAEQYHGFPEACSGLLIYPGLRRYVSAVIRACETSASIVYTLENSNPNSASDRFTSDPFGCVDIEPGMAQELPYGMKMNAVAPQQPSAQHDILIDSMVNECARCFDLPLIIALGSARKANFSAANFDMFPYEQSTKVDRQGTEIEVYDPLFGQWYDEALLIEDYLPAGMRRRYGTADMIPHGWGYDRIRRHADPLKEAEANKVALATGEVTLLEIHADRGSDARAALESEARLLGVTYQEYTEAMFKHRFEIQEPKPQEAEQEQEEPASA